MRTSFTKNMDRLIRIVEKRVNAIRIELDTTALDITDKKVANLIVEVEQAYCFAGIIKHLYEINTLDIPGCNAGTFDCIKTLKDLVRLINTPLLAHTKYLPEKIKYTEALFRALYAPEWRFDDAIIEKFRIYLEYLPKVVGEDFLHIQKTTLEPVGDDFLNTKIADPSSKIRWKKNLLTNSVMAESFKNNKDLKTIYDNRLPLYKQVLDSGIPHNPPALKFPSQKTLKKLEEGSLATIAKVEHRGNEYSFRSVYSSEIINKYHDLSKDYTVQQLKTNVHRTDRTSLADISINVQDFLTFSEEVLDKIDSKSNWSKRLKKMKFLEVKNEFTIAEVLNISGVSHWVGLPNVGKSTIMKALSAYLCYNNMVDGKIVLIMKDNPEVNDTLREFEKFDFIKATPMLGTQYETYIQNEIEACSNEDEHILESIMENNILSNYSNACRLKGLLDISDVTVEESIDRICHNVVLYKYNQYHHFDDTDEEDGEESSNKKSNLYKVNKTGFTCPYLFECEKYKNRLSLETSNVIVTNIHSFIQSTTQRGLFDHTVTFAEYLLKNASLIMVDEADLAQSVASQKFAAEDSLIDSNTKSLFEIRYERIEDASRGKKADNPELSRWLTDARIVKNLGEFILERIIHGDFLIQTEKKSTFTSRSLMYSLANQVSKKGKLLDSYANNLETDVNFSNEELLNEAGSKLRKSINEDLADFKRILEKYENNEITLRNFESSHKEDILEGNFDLYKLYIFLISAAKEKKEGDYEYYLNKAWSEFLKYHNLDEQKVKVSQKKKLMERLGVSIITQAFEILYSKVMYYGEIYAIMLTDIDESSNVRTSYIKKYKGLIPLNPTFTQMGLKYTSSGDGENKKHGLSLSNYFHVGSYIIEHMDKIYSILDKMATAHVVLLSATSYMPKSPKYHINIIPQYIIENEDREDGTKDLPTLYYKAMQLLDSNGNPLRLSGESSYESDDVIEYMCKDLCKVDTLSGYSKLDKIMSYAKPNRKRIALAVGSFSEARTLYDILRTELLKHPALSSKYKACIIETDPEILAEHTDTKGVFDKKKLKDFYKEDYNIAIMVVKSVERGINILTDDNGQKVAAFSVVVYLKRPYPVPNSLDDLVSLVNMTALRRYKRELTLDELGSYSISSEVATITKEAYVAENDFYSRDYYAYLKPSQREYILGDLMALTQQFEGRFTRGNVEATVIFACGSFFPRYNYDDLNKQDDIKSSIIKGFEAYLDSFDNVENPTELDKINQVIMNKLYGYRKGALKNIEFLD